MKRKVFTLFSDHDRSLLRQQPRAAVQEVFCPRLNFDCGLWPLSGALPGHIRNDCPVSGSQK